MMSKTNLLLLPIWSLALFSTLPSYADITTVFPDEVGDCSVSMYANCDSSPDQGQLELAGSTGAQSGNWDDLSGGVANRPYVTRLSIHNGSEETVLLSGGITSSSLSDTPGSVGVIISPTNLCDSTQTPGTSCYATPNRIQVTLAYRKQSGSIGYNFSFPNDGDTSTTTGDPLDLLSFDGTTPITIDQDTVIDMTLALNTLGSSLRWTWLNGIPSYWHLSSLGSPTATVRLKFKLATQPAIAWNLLDSGATLCSAIPVSTCEVTTSHSEWLSGSMILSLDNTLSAGMTGALFATDGAIIGSVDTSTDGSTGLPRLVYGLSSSHLDSVTGEARTATLRTFIPDATLVQVLGIPSFVDRNAAPTNATDVLAVERIGTSSTVTRSFDEWTSSANGANGLLMTVSGITFSAPQYRLKSKSGAPKVPSVSLTRGNYKFTLAATSGSEATTCHKQSCRVEIYRAATSKLSSTLTKVTSKVASKTAKGFSASFAIPKSGSVKKNTRFLAVVKNKGGKVLSSTPIVLNK